MNLTTKKRLNDGREMPLFGLGVFRFIISIGQNSSLQKLT